MTTADDNAGGIITAATAKTTSTALESSSKVTTTSTTTRSGPGFESEPTTQSSTSTVKVATSNFASSVVVERAEDKNQKKADADAEPEPVKPARQPKSEAAKDAKKEPEVKADIKPKSQVARVIRKWPVSLIQLVRRVLGPSKLGLVCRLLITLSKGFKHSLVDRVLSWL